MASTRAIALQQFQNRIADLLGCRTETRASLVSGMLHRNPSEAAAYWLQLVVSIGIATLGLVLGSTAAVIGAMLMAPLMGPIVGLAMGLATGSPFLVLRSGWRVVASVVVVVGGAALITVMLPFHEVNAEIAARTTPTALDLLIAAFCALAGVYSTLRPGSDTTATAAGTSISISLVPPLCASGYGVGTTVWSVASGAALLFLTNLVAIVFVGTLSFLAAGFNQVPVRELEHKEFEHAGDSQLSWLLTRRLDGLLGPRSGPWLRVLMPFVLLAVVYLPLRSALDEVAWEVRVRAAIRDSIGTVAQPVVESRVRVERHRVEVAVVLLGKSDDAESARARLERDIQSVAGVAPQLQVLAIPDASALAGLESSLRQPSPAPAPSPPFGDSLDRARNAARAAMERHFPTENAGPILRLTLDVSADPLRVGVVHHGATLPDAAIEAIQRSVSADLERPVRIMAAAVPAAPLTRKDGDLQMIAALSRALRDASGSTELSVCITLPSVAGKAKPDAKDKALSESILALVGNREGTRVEQGVDFGVRFVRGPCAAGEGDAGVAEAGPDGTVADAAGGD